MSSQYLISARWMSRRGLLRSLGRCCLELVALLVAGGAAGVLPVSLNCPYGSNQHKIWAVAGESLYLRSEVGRGIWKQFCMVIRLLLPISLETMHNPKESVLLIAIKIMQHAKLCLSVIMFLICVCWHPERKCRALYTCGQRGQV